MRQQQSKDTSLLGVGSSIALIAFALKDLSKGPIQIPNLILAMVGAGLLSAQITLVCMGDQDSDANSKKDDTKK